MSWKSLLIAAACCAPLTADLVLYDNKEAKTWQNEVYPIGNGFIGATLFGGVASDRLQFTVDSFWLGNENLAGEYNRDAKTPGGDCFGSHQTMGDLMFHQTAGTEIEGGSYRRELDIEKAMQRTQWKSGGVTYTREAIASHPAGLVMWRMTASEKGKLSGRFELKGGHSDLDKIRIEEGDLKLNGQLVNQLAYGARVKVVHQGGKRTEVNGQIQIENADEILVFLSANTSYVMNRTKGWMDESLLAGRVDDPIQKAAGKSWKVLLAEHLKDHGALFDRVKIDLGETEESVAQLPLRERIQRYRNLGKPEERKCLDPDLEEILYQYGRYLLIASSRPGTIPANLQGIWNNSNNPAWFADYHTNINIQMNYWLAENANLPELAQPFFDFFTSGVPVYEMHTQKKYGKDQPGFVTRMSINIFGGGGWAWNVEGTAWIAQHYWTHYLYSGDKEFLKKQAYPFVKGVSEFWLTQLKELPDGTIVVPKAWSHEHGPVEDGTAHAQQLMWDLFSNTLEAARELNVDREFQQKLETTIAKLAGPKIGSWGQLMEWMEEKPQLEKSNHRHTSHLFGVYPGRQISLEKTPDLAKAAKVSLTQRGEVGDSRQGWAWAWRTSLWSRLGDAEKAHGCVSGLLAYNVFDNLWGFCPGVFQIDGNFGITAGMTEMLMQSHAGCISLLPALPNDWPTGSIQGIRAQGGVIVSLAWKDGKLQSAKFYSPVAKEIKVRVPGENELRSIKLSAKQSKVLSFK